MSGYHFITKWEIQSPVEKVYDAIYEINKWPSWWRNVLQVKDVRTLNNDGVGDIKSLTWRGFFAYEINFQLEVTAVDPMKKLSGKVSGDLEGTGVWEFEANNRSTAVTYFWDVCTTKKWMNFLSPVARPVFRWNHDYVMKCGAQGLSRYTGSALLKS